MKKINSVLVNISQDLTNTEKQMARSNIDAQVYTVASGIMSLTVDDTSAVLSMPAEDFDISYPLKLTTTSTKTKLGVDLSSFMTLDTYNGLLDTLTAGSNITISDDLTVNKTDTTYTADKTSGVSLSGTNFSLLIASSTQRGGVMIGKNLSIDSDGILSTTCHIIGLESGTKSIPNTDYQVTKVFMNSLPTITQTSSVYTINAGIHSAQNYVDNTRLISDISSNFDGNDLSIHVTYLAATAGSNADDGSRFIYLKNGVPTASSAILGGTGTVLYLKSGVITASTDTLGSSVSPIYCNASSDLYEWYLPIGSKSVHMKKNSDGQYVPSESKYFTGTASSLKNRFYHYVDSSGTTQESSTTDGQFSTTAIADAMASGTTNFVFNYSAASFWTAMNNDSELLYVPVRYMVPGVKYTYSYNRDNIRLADSNDNYGGYYNKEASFGFDFDLSNVESSSDTVAAYYYGFLTGTIHVTDSTIDSGMHSPFYIQQNTNQWNDCGLVCPCYHKYSPSSDGKTANFTYPYGISAIGKSTTTFTSPVVISHNKSYNHMYWRIMVGNGYNDSSSYCYDTRVGPMHSLTFMRGYDIEGIPTIFALSYT